jgi:TatD DNase family protein
MAMKFVDAHIHLSDEEYAGVVDEVLAEAKNSGVVALVSNSMDLKTCQGTLRLAEKLSLPTIIHSRGATVQVVDMLPSYKLRKVLLHWFSNPISALDKAVERDYYITEGPATLYSNGIREVVKKVPLTNLLTETDGPVRFFKKPFEGKRTTPSFIPAVIAAFAEVKKISVEEVAGQILNNFQNFFDVEPFL